jgi:hypothetical protein
MWFPELRFNKTINLHNAGRSRDDHGENILPTARLEAELRGTLVQCPARFSRPTQTNITLGRHAAS